MIRVRGLDVTFAAPDGAEARILQGVDLDVAAGEMTVLRGVSGSGKTTLLSVLGALLRPTRGQVEVDGRAIAKLPDSHAAAFRRETVGFLFQDHRLLTRLSVRDNVALPRVAAGDGPGRIDERVDQALRLTRLEELAPRTAADLSGGEKQRCALARALVGSPRLLLCDEPTANLDAAGRDLLLEILTERKQAGVTVLIATHDPLFDRFDAVDRSVGLADGRIGRILPS